MLNKKNLAFPFFFFAKESKTRCKRYNTLYLREILQEFGKKNTNITPFLPRNLVVSVKYSYNGAIVAIQ